MTAPLPISVQLVLGIKAHGEEKLLTGQIEG